MVAGVCGVGLRVNDDGNVSRSHAAGGPALGSGIQRNVGVLRLCCAHGRTLVGRVPSGGVMDAGAVDIGDCVQADRRPRGRPLEKGPR